MPEASASHASARRLGCLAAAALLASTASGFAAFAGDSLNSDDKPVNTGDTAEQRQKKDIDHDDFNIVPIVGGSSDIGVGGGYFSNLAHLKTGFDPYVWDIESAGLITFKPGDSGVIVPYTDIYMKLSIPRLFGHPIRLEIRPSFTAETTSGYYGLGNNSPAALPAGKADSYQQYGRTHPQLDVDLRFKIIDHLSSRLGGRFTRNWLQVGEGTLLASDMATGSAEVKSLLGAARPSDVLLIRTGMQWDTRDNEASTYQGSLDTLDVRLSPGGGAFPYRYGEATLNLRAFIPIRTPYITLAGRFVCDLLFGDAPFYELAHFDDTYALGGTNGVRGIPSGRYQGKIKVFGNLELRNELLVFHALGKPLVFGVVAFLDGGRVWADYGSNPQLDGNGLGLHYGAGAGLRLQSGSAFVLRADLAWSPDATPIGGYFSAGQLF